jgi:hypothetical protein
VLSRRGLCDELIACPEESYRLWCIVVCDLETSRMRRPWPALGRSTTEKKKCISLGFITRIYHDARYSECQIKMVLKQEGKSGFILLSKRTSVQL